MANVVYMERFGYRVGAIPYIFHHRRLVLNQHKLLSISKPPPRVGYVGREFGSPPRPRWPAGTL